MGYTKTHFFSPSRTILLSITLTILAGTLLLGLPACHSEPISLIDLFFTATSCTCVTGLLTVPFESFTIIGHAVMMALIQIGGLGLITLTFCVVSLFVNLGLSSQVMAGEMLDLSSWKQMKKILLFILGLTFILETIGACFIFSSLRTLLPLKKALFYSAFHAVSSFCNAGITPFEGGMIPFVNNPTMLLISSLLMISGGLGFITWKDLLEWIRARNGKKRTSLSLQTRIIVFYYFAFIAAGTILFWLLERSNAFELLSFPLQWCNAFFTSVTSRSGGFFSVHPDDMQHSSIFTIMINAFIGSAPGSTGSGIKITTTAIFISTIHSAIQGKGSVDWGKRSIARDQVYRAVAIVALSVVWIIGTTFLLLITEDSWPFLDLIFETVSAFSTLGASLGITPYLSAFGKLLLCLSMFAGRMGSLTLMIALRKKAEPHEYSYPEERVMVT